MRSRRAALKRAVKTGDVTLAEALESDDPASARMRVSELLASLPGMGRVGASQAMARLGIAPGRRVGGLGPRQREALLREFGAR